MSVGPDTKKWKVGKSVVRMGGMDNDVAVTRWLAALQDGDDEAFERVWDWCYPKLVRMARLQLNPAKRRVYDEEDAALSAFRSFYHDVRAGRWGDLEDRQQLWRMLTTQLMRKIISRRRADAAHKRGDDRVRGESAFVYCGREGIDGLVSGDPSPELVAELLDEADAVLAQLSPPLRRVALLKMNGLSNLEIAAEIGLTGRSVERKLEQIRRQFANGNQDSPS